MFENLGSAELLVVLIIVLIFFGPKRIPELARSFGKGMRKFNDAKQGFEKEVRTAMKEPIDSLTQARTNLEKQLKETGDPIKDLLNEPVVYAQPPAAFTPPPGALARGSYQPPESEDEPAAPNPDEPTSSTDSPKPTQA